MDIAIVIAIAIDIAIAIVIAIAIAIVIAIAIAIAIVIATLCAARCRRIYSFLSPRLILHSNHWLRGSQTCSYGCGSLC